MGFPDRIERTIDLPLAPSELWPVLTTAEGIASWFSDRAEIELRAGGAMTLTWDDTHAPTMRVERADEPHVFAFSWPLEDDGVDTMPRTYVEFTLEPASVGTRLTVVESGFAQLPDSRHRGTYDGHGEGWDRELGELVDRVAHLVSA